MTRAKVLSLYRSLLRESAKFPSYNYRAYFRRRTKDAFHVNKGLTDPAKIDEMCSYAQQNLEIIKRQVIIGQMYQTTPLIIEAASEQK